MNSTKVRCQDKEEAKKEGKRKETKKYLLATWSWKRAEIL